MSSTGAVDIVVNNKDELRAALLSVGGGVDADEPRRVVVLDGDDTLVEGRRYRDKRIHWFDTFFNTEIQPDDINFPALIIYLR